MTAKPDIERLRELLSKYPETFDRANAHSGPTNWSAKESIAYMHSEFANALPALLTELETLRAQSVPRAWWEELRRMVTGCHISQPAVVCDEKHSLATGFDNQRRILDWIQFQMARIEEGKE